MVIVIKHKIDSTQVYLFDAHLEKRGSFSLKGILSLEAFSPIQTSENVLLYTLTHIVTISKSSLRYSVRPIILHGKELQAMQVIPYK